MSNETNNAAPVAPVAPVTRRLDDIEFITICERVAKSDDPSIDAIMEQTGLTKDKVSARRSEINKTYAGAFKLTSLPRGGKKKTKADISDTVAKLRELGFVSTKIDAPEDSTPEDSAPESETDLDAGDETDELYEDVEDTETSEV